MKALILCSLASIALLTAHPSFAAPALDGSVGALCTSSCTDSVILSLTTTGSKDVIVVGGASNGADITGVSAAGLTFTERTSETPTYISEWVATASAPFSGNITVSLTGSITYYSLAAFGVSGIASLTTPWDGNASVPAKGTSGTPTISTSSSSDFVFTLNRLSTPASPGIGSGWTSIYAPASGYFIAEYQVVSSPQSSLQGTWTGGGSSNGWIMDAAVGSGAAPAVNPSQGFLGQFWN